ncbi:RRP12-like protein [Chionoecetes opilio]|uniref:RRP12-like protein n=1 Tax=Chionoecetes opilio TaxID=41210 RepID=A0A8J4XY56_CHIOP|nr:RRP12-like protein [Chionoecetes opilio]
MARMRLKKTSAKGHKWKKGQSCVSNPGLNKHRQAARGCFFQRLDGNSNLTQAALDQHNQALQSGEKNGIRKAKTVATNGDEEKKEKEMTEMERQMKEMEVEEEDLDSGGGKTFNTFATSFSSCTLPAFEK